MKNKRGGIFTREVGSKFLTRKSRCCPEFCRGDESEGMSFCFAAGEFGGVVFVESFEFGMEIF